jgi:hypothetical protein
MGEDAWVSGALIVLFSIASFIAFSEWEEWGIAIVGLWLILSPWVLGFQNATAMKVNVGIGMFVAYLAAIELFSSISHHRPWRTLADPKSVCDPNRR